MTVHSNHPELGSENMAKTSRKYMAYNNITTSALIEEADCLNNLSINIGWSQLENQVVYHQGCLVNQKTSNC